MDGKPLRLIAATDTALGIGRDGRLPWHLPNEFDRFLSRVTAVSGPGKRNLLIWGRHSAVRPSQPLPNCHRVCLSRNLSCVPPGADHLCRDFASAVQLAYLPPLSDHIETIWVLGGTHVYQETFNRTRASAVAEAPIIHFLSQLQEALKHPNCDQIYLTNIMADFNCDTFFPEFDRETFRLLEEFPGIPSEIQEENGIKYKFQVFQKVTSQ
ncbi:zgc:153031 isoform X1 [Pristis pectinata]|uniref:zgc:153031 isoform X1 n=1 Tax=Pristis pectinata TaxID=685728 RepID=UPI00223D49E0|nr:zgc:153031 isoform X1 [Pristis pectinata]